MPRRRLGYVSSGECSLLRSPMLKNSPYIPQGRQCIQFPAGASLVVLAVWYPTPTHKSIIASAPLLVFLVFLIYCRYRPRRSMRRHFL
jgi:hypothetical protein